MTNVDTSNAPDSNDYQDKTADAATIIALNKVVSFHYKLAEVAPDGSHGDWMEESSGGEPLFYLHGFHNVVVGLERARGQSCGRKYRNYPKTRGSLWPSPIRRDTACTD